MTATDAIPLRVVFVDDEDGILQGLRRSLRGRRKVWHMDFFTDAAQALASMIATPPDILVTDMRMPGMDGMALLREARKRLPRTIRLALSGQNDYESVLESHGYAHQFLRKPADGGELEQAIERAGRLAGEHHHPDLVAMVSSMGDLPPLPATHRRLLELIDEEETTIEGIAADLVQDPSLVAQVLRMANSPFLGHGEPVQDPDQAVALLGFTRVRQLILVQACSKLLSPDRLALHHLDGVIEHSLDTTARVRRVIRRCGWKGADAEILVSAALLHDIGRLLIAVSEQLDYAAVMRDFEASDEPLQSVERRLLGFDHAEAGALVLACWHLPARLCDLVLRHHDPLGVGTTEGTAQAVALHLACAREPRDSVHDRLHVPLPLAGWDGTAAIAAALAEPPPA